MTTNTTTTPDTSSTEATIVRTKPNIREIALAQTLNVDDDGAVIDHNPFRPVVAGDKVPFWNGSFVAHHTVTKGEMLKVERYRARHDKQVQHEADRLAREAAAERRAEKRAERDKAHQRQVEAERRAEVAREAVARIAAATIQQA